MIVDAHMHIWKKIHGQTGGQTSVRPVRNGLVRFGNSTQYVLGMPATHLDCSARGEWALAEFDAAGVDVGVVVQEYMDGEQNRYAFEEAAKSKGRFFVHALPDFFKPGQVAREAGRLFDRGFRGLKLAAGHLLGKIDLDDERFLPIWARMEDEGLVLSADLAADKGQVEMMEKILARHPKLKVAIGHFGLVNRKGWPGQLRLCRHKNVYMESGGIIWLYKNEGYPFPSAIKAIVKAGNTVGMEKLMWGSDWPRTMVDFTYRQSISFIWETRQLTDAQKSAFLGANAARLYGLKPGKGAVSRKPAPLITGG